MCRHVKKVGNHCAKQCVVTPGYHNDCNKRQQIYSFSFVWSGAHRIIPFDQNSVPSISVSWGARSCAEHARTSTIDSKAYPGETDDRMCLSEKFKKFSAATFLFAVICVQSSWRTMFRVVSVIAFALIWKISCVGPLLMLAIRMATPLLPTCSVCSSTLSLVHVISFELHSASPVFQQHGCCVVEWSTKNAPSKIWVVLSISEHCRSSQLQHLHGLDVRPCRVEDACCGQVATGKRIRNGGRIEMNLSESDKSWQCFKRNKGYIEWLQ